MGASGVGGVPASTAVDHCQPGQILDRRVDAARAMARPPPGLRETTATSDVDAHSDVDAYSRITATSDVDA